MRIIAGNLKGKKIIIPNDSYTRPLKDLTKESIFNIIKHSNLLNINLENSKVLDLFAGVGSFGLECLSRGAKKVFFVEKEKEAIKILEKNIIKLNVSRETKILHSDVFNVLRDNKSFFACLPHVKLDLIFCDPPFKNEKINNLIELIIEKNLLKKNGIIVFHKHKNTNEKINILFETIDKRTYGLSEIIFGKVLSS